MKVYNTLTRKKEEFVPLEGNKVNFFVCGPTVYDYSHIGHAKTYTQFDFIVRFLKKLGYKVFYLQNITDIDDKIIKRAKELNISEKELAVEYEEKYFEDMHSLHNVSVDKYARATDFIPQIINQVKKLMVKGNAYKIDDGIYFDLLSFKEYGKLSGRSEIKEEDAVSRIDENAQKKNKGDFCLWKFYKVGDPFWESELGKGRPGWHIEDTAITETFLGEQYDVHGGAVDLIFPHHEAEISQMECCSGKKPFVKYWLHTAFLNINSEKMAKSKGNFFTIREILKKYDYKTLRFFFLSNHYRTPLDFTEEVLNQSKNSISRIQDFIFNLNDEDDSSHKELLIKYKKEIMVALEDDFNTPIAIASIFCLIKELNKLGGAGRNTLKLFKELNELFDFIEFDKGVLDSDIDVLVKEREEARETKDFSKADKIRNDLKEKGIHLEDTPKGVRWKKV